LYLIQKYVSTRLAEKKGPMKKPPFLYEKQGFE
jgi:hypothetical protein